MKKVPAFLAYASTPDEIGRTIEAFAKTPTVKHHFSELETWKNLDIAGRFISDSVLRKIDAKEYFIADISTLNFNVTYELGYAIGKCKKIWLIRNTSLDDSQFKADMNNLGLFDTIGHKPYNNTSALAELTKELHLATAQTIPTELNTKAPVYILDTEIKTDYSQAVISRIKKAGLFYRSFDPSETPRMAAYDVISNVAQSYGVVVCFLGSEFKDSSIHNQRAAFIAGLAQGLEKELLLFQFGDGPVPLDYRDFVHRIKDPKEIVAAIADFAPAITRSIQKEDIGTVKISKNILDKVKLGASAAENELRELPAYYVETDAFKRTMTGEIRVILGRKGSGKTALFARVRDKKRSNKQNIVIDLKPETYKLLKFKNEVLALLEDGTLEHSIMAFWEYILYLEICYKVLEKDASRHVYDHELYAPYQKLYGLYHSADYISDGDFSERVSSLLQIIKHNFANYLGDGKSTRLNRAEVTKLTYIHQIRELRDALVEYLQFKEEVCVLIDNLDKGWNTFGVAKEDLIILRTLLDASRKIENHLSGQSIECCTTIFLRNDIYELLLSAMSDRGKEQKTLLDWTDRSALTEMIRRRIAASLKMDIPFSELWNKIADSHTGGEPSFEYLLDRCLMRPRILIDLLSTCRACALNRGSNKITAEDIDRATKEYSFDLIREINLEIRDVFPRAEDVLYRFMNHTETLSKDDLYEIFLESGIEDESDWNNLIETLLWYGFIGVLKATDEKTFIYNVGYQMKILKAKIDKEPHVTYCINPAFWGALETSAA